MTMKIRTVAFAACLHLAFTTAALAQVPVLPSNDHAALLASADTKLAENKRLVYDFGVKCSKQGTWTWRRST